MMSTLRFSLSVSVLSLALSTWVLAAVNTIRFATVVPEGTGWYKAMRRMADEIKAQTGGEVAMKIYASGKMGDELDALRKMRSGQLHAGAFAGMGLGAVQPAIRVMELPYLFRSKEEIDYVSDKMYPEFVRLFEEKGMILVGMSDPGLVYLYTQVPIRAPEDLAKLNVWVWEGDPLAREFFRISRANPVSLPITEVPTALQTGMVNAVYTPPQGLIAFQWYPKVSYMIRPPLISSVGGILITRRKWETIEARHQRIIRRIARKTGHDLTRLSRRDNAKAIEALEKNHLQVFNPRSDVIADLKKDGLRVKEILTGKLYSRQVLSEVEKYLKDFRAQRK